MGKHSAYYKAATRTTAVFNHGPLSPPPFLVDNLTGVKAEKMLKTIAAQVWDHYCDLASKPKETYILLEHQEILRREVEDIERRLHIHKEHQRFYNRVRKRLKAQAESYSGGATLLDSIAEQPSMMEGWTREPPGTKKEELPASPFEWFVFDVGEDLPIRMSPSQARYAYLGTTSWGEVLEDAERFANFVLDEAQLDRTLRVARFRLRTLGNVLWHLVYLGKVEKYSLVVELKSDPPPKKRGRKVQYSDEEILRTIWHIRDDLESADTKHAVAGLLISHGNVEADIRTLNRILRGLEEEGSLAFLKDGSISLVLPLGRQRLNVNTKATQNEERAATEDDWPRPPLSPR